MDELKIITGKVTLEPQTIYVGDKNLPLTTISVAISKDKYIDLKMYGYNFTDEVKNLKVGDMIMATGTIQTKQHNGKKFTNLVVNTIHKSL